MMNAYAVALTLHIVGALGMFVALGLEWVGLGQMWSAMAPQQVRPWMGILKSARGLGLASMLAAVISGFYMMATAWDGEGWLVVSIGALVLVMVLGTILTGPRMAAIGRALATGKGSGPSSLQSLTDHPLLWISIQTRVAIALGIVVLKTFKPDLTGALLIIGVAVALGLVSALPMPRREHAQEGSAN